MHVRRWLLWPLHFAWRYAWAWYEGTPVRVTRWWYTTLDSAHDRLAYPGERAYCVCNRFGGAR